MSTPDDPTVEHAKRPVPCYWDESRQPLHALALLAPLLVIYEIGMLLLPASTALLARNGADYWMRSVLSAAGVTFPYVLPLLPVVVLAGWHVCMRHSWTVSRETLVGMALECSVLACVLILLGQFVGLLFDRWGLLCVEFSGSVSQEGAPVDLWSQIVGYVGAGVYEETLFRLGLIPCVYSAARLCLIPTRISAVLAVGVTSLVFAVAHYVSLSGGDPIFRLSDAAAHLAAHPEAWYGFTFRALAGVIFSVLFVVRGFGIAAGTHAAYDIAVGIVLIATRG